MKSAKKNSLLLVFSLLILSKALALPVYLHDHDHEVHKEEHCEDECALCEFAIEMQNAAFSLDTVFELPTKNVVFIEKATSQLQFHFITQETNSYRVTRPPPIFS